MHTTGDLSWILGMKSLEALKELLGAEEVHGEGADVEVLALRRVLEAKSLEAMKGILEVKWLEAMKGILEVKSLGMKLRSRLRSGEEEHLVVS